MLALTPRGESAITGVALDSTWKVRTGGREVACGGELLDVDGRGDVDVDDVVGGRDVDPAPAPDPDPGMYRGLINVEFRNMVLMACLPCDSLCC